MATTKKQLAAAVKRGRIPVSKTALESARNAYHGIVRLVLESRGKCDDPKCPGWIVAVVDRFPGVEIQVCDDCNPAGNGLTDYDVQALPEAQRALAAHPATQEDPC